MGSVRSQWPLGSQTKCNNGLFRSLSDTIIIAPVVDAVDFAYYVAMSNCLDDFDQKIYGVRIYYT